LWEGIKNIVSSVAEWFSKTASNIAKFFSDAWSKIKNSWSKAGEWFSNIKAKIAKPFEKIGSWFSEKFQDASKKAKNAWSDAGSWFSNIKQKITSPFEKVGGWFANKFSAAYKNITSAFSNAGIDFSDVWAGIKKVFNPKDFLSIGGNMISGLWEGIKDKAKWLKDKISGWVGDIVGWFKDKLGIHSPSTVMRDEIGKMLGLGMAEGIEDSRNVVNNAVRKLGDAALGGLSPVGGGATGAAAGGRVINYTQNNYSPRALSRREIYRQTHNALAFAGGA
jgi:phage-related protein